MSMRSFARAVYLTTLPRLLEALPLRWSFTALVLARRTRFPGTGLLALSLRYRSAKRLNEARAFSFSTRLSDRFPIEAAEILVLIGAFREGSEILTRSAAAKPSAFASLVTAKSLFEFAEFDRALAVLSAWHSPTELVYLKGYLELIAGDESRAGRLLCLAAAQDPPLMRPHQNLAARLPRTYTPNYLDVAAGTQGRLYDGYNYIGQRVTHVGAGDLGPKLYAGALQAQRALRGSWPELSVQLKATLLRLDINLDTLRLLPQEWVTQVGHLGMLEILFRMRDLGWWTGHALVLAPTASVANQAMLSLFEDQCQIFPSNSAADMALFDEISSLQRYCGMCFNAFELPSGQVVPWQEAGAMLICRWEAEQREHPLVRKFDARFGTDDQVLATVAQAKSQWGMGPNDWYVCIHLRDASHYGEMRGTGQTHRNAAVASYLPMVEHVTKQGGWVIKLGGPNSPKFPKMERLVDYARSPFKSDTLDLHLIRHARYFVGTTSGLTNVAVSFGVPSALVNCITVDAQLWSDRVRFALKPVRNREGRCSRRGRLHPHPGVGVFSGPR